MEELSTIIPSYSVTPFTDTTLWNTSYDYEVAHGNDTEPVAASDLYPLATRSVFTVCFCVTFVLGLAGNLLVIAVVVRDRELSRSSTGAFIGNLAISDLLVLAVCLPTSLAELHSPPFSWVLPPPLCEYGIISGVLIILLFIIIVVH